MKLVIKVHLDRKVILEQLERQDILVNLEFQDHQAQHRMLHHFLKALPYQEEMETKDHPHLILYNFYKHKLDLLDPEDHLVIKNTDLLFTNML